MLLRQQLLFLYQLNNLHPEFLDGNGSYVEEELLAVRFTDPDDLLDEDDED